jgi:hypothetical protein
VAWASGSVLSSARARRAADSAEMDDAGGAPPYSGSRVSASPSPAQARANPLSRAMACSKSPVARSSGPYTSLSFFSSGPDS